MRGERADQYQALVDQWKTVADAVPGWEELDVLERRGDYPVRTTMPNYLLGGVFFLPDSVKVDGWAFANPRCDIAVTTSGIKCHLNRFCRTLDETYESLIVSGFEDGADAWVFLNDAQKLLSERHEGEMQSITMRTAVGRRTKGLATGVISTSDVQLTMAADPLAFHFTLTFPVHTVCPFMIYEAGGHSHTQRTYLTATLHTKRQHGPVRSLESILALIDERLQAAQSSMRIPDEAVHCLRAYATPTYTEDGCMRLLTCLRDSRAVWAPTEEKVPVDLHVQSLESIFTVDIIGQVSAIV